MTIGEQVAKLAKWQMVNDEIAEARKGLEAAEELVADEHTDFKKLAHKLLASLSSAVSAIGMLTDLAAEDVSHGDR